MRTTRSSFHRFHVRFFAAVLEPGQLQHPIDDARDARGLVADVGDETGLLLGGHVFLQKLRRAADGGEGAFQFVGEGLDVLFRVLPAFQGLLHAAQRQAEIGDLGAPELGKGRVLAQADTVRVAREAIDRTSQPIGKGEAEQRRDGDGEERSTDEGGPGQLEEGVDADGGLGEGQDAGHAPFFIDRRGDVKHGGKGIVRILERSAGAVPAFQGELDVAELAVVLAQGLGLARVEARPSRRRR